MGVDRESYDCVHSDILWQYYTMVVQIIFHQAQMKFEMNKC